MRKRVPLNAIRAFEAVARNQSVAKAADELCVTPTAVSHQIRLLEDFLQADLFTRKNSRIYLTPESTAILARISSALDLIDESVSTLQTIADEKDRQLAVGVSSSVASHFLMPRIGHFLSGSPEIDLSLHTYLTVREAEAQQIDLTICNWDSSREWRREALVEEEIMPVCTPAMAQAWEGDHARLLAEAPLIHTDRVGFDGNMPDWGRYLGEYGIPRKDQIHGPRFNQAGSAIEAARSGVGVMLGRSLLIQHALERGELVAVGESYPERSVYYMLSPWKSERATLLQQFKDWLLKSVEGNGCVRAV
ncbi:LysR substrate-binding domain-containing protein [Allosediminivita pacifica]|uniref:LysR family glycine cleavage system transcriptional activator n=1 Tax=Allosediminivita pacifica TaxID=1267769 RepID=A0A2T6ATT1_9RHOB|nr:LysR substrate-binding domain-containing protein [Allosediminivita pacifica]PTX47221.1 LysR family glycine cleavage system transcriptional activator [Allosediminivita pacifica]GGB09316.1 LysR family transcriptional regulator [Allosediminivita pacifica]